MAVWAEMMAGMVGTVVELEAVAWVAVKEGPVAKVARLVAKEAGVKAVAAKLVALVVATYSNIIERTQMPPYSSKAHRY